MAVRHFPPLSYRIRADLFVQLARMEIAGLPFDKALGFVGLPKSAQPRVEAMKRWIGHKLDIADAGEQSGLFTPMEAALIRAAINAGTPGATYNRLAERYRKRVLQITKFKSRMALPVAIFVMASFIGPIPALASGALGASRYLFAVLRPIFSAAVLAWIVGDFPRWSEHPSLASLRSAIDHLLPRLPVFGETSVRRNLRDFFESLALLLDAGVPMLSALPLATATMRNRYIRSHFIQLGSRIESGLSFAQAIREIPFPGRERAYPLIVSGESSGALPETLFRYADFESDDIDAFDDSVAEWAPRLIYTCVAGWMAHSLLIGPGVGPQLPAELR